ncbi:etoposide-induced protein 2.4-domain-containing protein [Phycomyces nitens]|nr:etoposide-induced protein 2.4-domain-containing protein [Phycomyces nitens]
MYLVCLIVNARFFQTISKETFRLQTNFNQIDSSSPSRDISLAIYTTLLYTVFAAFVFLVGLVPFIGKTVSFVSSCIIMAYYCFEYKWTYIGWSRDQSMLFIEYHWAYFLGFGLPVAALTFFLSTLHAGAVFALVYPIFIIMASSASPKPSTTVYGEPLFSGGPIYLRPFTLPFHMPLFYAVRQMNNLFISLIRYVGGTKADAILTHKKDIVGKLV